MTTQTKTSGVTSPSNSLGNVGGISPWIIVPTVLAAAYTMVLVDSYRHFHLAGDGSTTQTIVGLIDWLPFVASAVYLVAIHAVQTVMRNRKPMDLRDAMIVYNVYQILLNL